MNKRFATGAENGWAGRPIAEKPARSEVAHVVLLRARHRAAVNRASQAHCEQLENRAMLSTFTVTSTADNNGPGTLPTEIAAAAAAPGVNTVIFDVSPQISSELTISVPMIINGNGDAIDVPADAPQFFALDVTATASPGVTIENLTMSANGQTNPNLLTTGARAVLTLAGGNTFEQAGIALTVGANATVNFSGTNTLQNCLELVENQGTITNASGAQTFLTDAYTVGVTSYGVMYINGWAFNNDDQAMNIQGGSVSATSCQFISDIAPAGRSDVNAGGAINISGGGFGTFTGCSINGTTGSAGSGPAVEVNQAAGLTTTFNGLVATGNMAQGVFLGYGGGTNIIENSTVANNQGGQSPELSFADGTNDVVNCELTRNSQNNSTVYFDGSFDGKPSSLTDYDTTCSYNTDGSSTQVGGNPGGGLGASLNTGAVLTVSNCSFVNNIAYAFGGGLAATTSGALAGGTFGVVATTITGNVSEPSPQNPSYGLGGGVITVGLALGVNSNIISGNGAIGGVTMDVDPASGMNDAGNNVFGTQHVVDETTDRNAVESFSPIGYQEGGRTTLTYEAAAGSAAIGFGASSLINTSDQNGLVRTFQNGGSTGTGVTDGADQTPYQAPPAGQVAKAAMAQSAPVPVSPTTALSLGVSPLASKPMHSVSVSSKSPSVKLAVPFSARPTSSLVRSKLATGATIFDRSLQLV